VITDAREYFPQFFHFSQHYAQWRNPDANVIFELRPTDFLDGTTQGFSVDYVIRPSAVSEEHLKMSIAVYLDALSDFLPLMGLTSLTPSMS
jgi:hypothetical protein